MAENMRYQTPTSWCYNDDFNQCAIYGGLYSWETAIDVCPEGWHLPSDDEWKTLEATLGMTQTEIDDTGWRGTDQGGQMKVTGIEYWSEPNGAATNESGFSSLPAGNRYDGIAYDAQSFSTYYWSSTEFDSEQAWGVELYITIGGLFADIIIQWKEVDCLFAAYKIKLL